MQTEPIRYPELTEELRHGPSFRMFKYFGAGAIIASVTIGSGETLFASKGGAIFGYTLLWCFLGGAIMKCIQVYAAARYMVLTGQHPMTHWARLPGPPCWVPLVIGVLSLICFPFFLGGLPLVVGKTINWIFHVPGSDSQLLLYARIWGTLCIVLAAGLTWLQSYDVLERVQTWIVGLLLICVFAAFFAADPDWYLILTGTLVPSSPSYPEWMLASDDADIKNIVASPTWAWIGLFLGAVGGGTYDYIGYIGCLREKKWGAIGGNTRATEEDWDHDNHVAQTLEIETSEQNIRRGKGWLWTVKIDVGIGFLAIFVFTACFVALGAQILHPQKLVPGENALLEHQAKFLTQFHPAMLYLYQLGVFTAFWGTIYGAFEIYARTAYECLAPLSAGIRKLSSARFREATILYCAIGGLILLWSTTDPERLVMPAAIVGGVFTCGLWCFAMIWADRKFLPKPLQMGSVLTILTWISGILLTVLGLRSFWDYASSWFG